VAQVAGFERNGAGLLVTDAVGAIAGDQRGIPRTAAGALAIGAGPVTQVIAGWPRNAAGRVATVDIGSATSPASVAGFYRNGGTSQGELVTDAAGPWAYDRGFMRAASRALGIV
jgi:hypothetical protein